MSVSFLTKGNKLWRSEQRKRGLGPLWVANCGKMTRKYMGDKTCLVRQIRAIFLLFLERKAHLQMEIYITFTKGNLCPGFR